MKIVLVAGARPNFIKAAPLWHALRRIPETSLRWVHTGQHRSAAMSAGIFTQLGLPGPDRMLSGHTSTAVRETARMALGLERVFNAWQPDWVVAIGDVTSALAAALAAKQSGFPLAHVEAGLRSFDRQMPEELNRIAVDHLADVLFPSEPAGVRNLEAEGIPPERVFFVGNVLIDALFRIMPQAKNMDVAATIRSACRRRDGRTAPREYALFTFHRPSNVDDPTGLNRLAEIIKRTAKHIPVVFPMHPRTLDKFRRFDAAVSLKTIPSLFLLRPLGYVEMIGLLSAARLVVTDSGGVQEESTCLHIPCLTFRKTTERPATVEHGSNTLIADLSPDTLEHYLRQILAGAYKTGAIPPLWDGHAAERLARVFERM